MHCPARDIHLDTHPPVSHICEEGWLSRWQGIASIWTGNLPYNGLEWHIPVQMNVTRKIR